MANRFVLNETSYHGAGAVKEIAGEAKGRGFQKALICSDPDLIKFGVTKKVTDVLDEAGLAYEIYSNIKANPTIENVQKGVEAFMAAEINGNRIILFKTRLHRMVNSAEAHGLIMIIQPAVGILYGGLPVAARIYIID